MSGESPSGSLARLLENTLPRKVSAGKLVDAGCHGLDDLGKPEFFNALHHTQQVSYKYRDQISQPVSREESEAVVDFLKKALDQPWEVLLVGS